MAWSPVGGGRLFGEMTDENTTKIVKALSTIAQQLGDHVTIDQVAYAWLLTHPAKLVPIVGTNKIERIQNLAKCEEIKLTKQQWFYILEAAAGKSVK